MSVVHQKPSDDTNAHQATEPYAVVVATKREGMDTVLYGLSATQSEQIATRKNREMDGDTEVHALPERRIREAHENLHRILTS